MEEVAKLIYMVGSVIFAVLGVLSFQDHKWSVGAAYIVITITGLIRYAKED